MSVTISVHVQHSLLVYIMIFYFALVSQSHQRDNEPMYSCHICDNLFQRGSLLTKHLMVQHRIFWSPGHSRFRSVQLAGCYSMCVKITLHWFEATGMNDIMQLQTIQFHNNGKHVGTLCHFRSSNLLSHLSYKQLHHTVACTEYYLPESNPDVPLNH
jgi:hypothetical protein